MRVTEGGGDGRKGKRGQVAQGLVGCGALSFYTSVWDPGELWVEEEQDLFNTF